MLEKNFCYTLLSVYCSAPVYLSKKACAKPTEAVDQNKYFLKLFSQMFGHSGVNTAIFCLDVSLPLRISSTSLDNGIITYFQE